MNRTQEDIDFLKELFVLTKEQISLSQKILKQIERSFSRNPDDEFVEENLREMYDSLQSMNQCLSFSDDDDKLD